MHYIQIMNAGIFSFQITNSMLTFVGEKIVTTCINKINVCVGLTKIDFNVAYCKCN